MNTKRTATADTITYTATIDGTEVAWLTITADNRIVENVETRTDYQRQGIASHLWAVANADGEAFHALEHHRTAKGEAFANSVGGETIDNEAGFVAVCGVCTGDF